MRRPRTAPISGDQLVTLSRQLAAQGKYIRSWEVAGIAGYRVLDIASEPKARPVQTELRLKFQISNLKSSSPRAAWWFDRMRQAAGRQTAAC